MTDASEQFLCRWGRDIFMEADALPCMTPATRGVVLHDPDDKDLVSVVIKVCEKHLTLIAEQSILTPPEQVAEYNERYGD